MMRLFPPALCLAIGLAVPVLATPPRVTSSDDRIVAATQTNLYVLRDVWDNQGSHYTSLHDQHLIEIDLDSGAAVRHWPLRRLAASHLDEAGEFRVPGEVRERDGETHDMIAVLRDLEAEPLSPSHWPVADLTLSDGALMRAGEQLLTPFGIRKAGRAQLAVLRDEYPPNQTAEGWPAEDQIAFYDLYAEGDWMCEIRQEGQTLFRAQDRVLVVKLHCEDAELSGIWSFHVLVKDDL